MDFVVGLFDRDDIVLPEGDDPIGKQTTEAASRVPPDAPAAITDSEPEPEVAAAWDLEVHPLEDFLPAPQDHAPGRTTPPIGGQVPGLPTRTGVPCGARWGASGTSSSDRGGGDA